MTEEVIATEQISTEPVVEIKTEESKSLVGGSSEDEIVTEGDDVSKEGDAKESKEDAPEKAEESKEIVYEEFKLPEGIVLDETLTNDFKGLAKEMNLSQEQAQKLVDFQTSMNQTSINLAQEQFKIQVDDWKKESITELGANWKQDMTVVAKAMNNFGSPELRELLNTTGLGNHKEVVKFFLSIGKKVSEDKIKDSDLGKDRVTKTLAEKHYPNTKSK